MIPRFLLKKMPFQLRRFFSYHQILPNYFKTDYPKKVLISYILDPFIRGTYNYKHTNYIESIIIAQAFHSLQYTVDIVEYSNTKKIDYSGYAVIFGFGRPIENYYKTAAALTAKVIYYGTGNQYNFINKVSIERAYGFYKKHGVLIASSIRFAEEMWSWQTMYADAMIVMGNEFTRQTWAKYYALNQEHIFTINAPFYKKAQMVKGERNWETARKNFVFFGSNCLIHRGLDLLLDLFLERSDIHLHLCCSLDNEPGFYNVYREKLKNAANIKVYGFVDIMKDVRFESILNTCGFVIYPSASEGGAPSVVTVMGNGGLIPVISRACSIDIPDGYGFIFENPDLNEIEQCINRALNTGIESLKTMSENVLAYTNTHFSLDKFEENMNHLINNIVA